MSESKKSMTPADVTKVGQAVAKAITQLESKEAAVGETRRCHYQAASSLKQALVLLRNEWKSMQRDATGF